MLSYKHPLDEKLMNRAAKYLEGTHDFAAFCSAHSDVEDTVRTIYHCDVKRSGDVIAVTISGDGFLYNMVRIIVGTLISVSTGKISPDDILQIIDSKSRASAGKTMPAKGLFLNKVFY